jgi:hypothetical protein
MRRVKSALQPLSDILEKHSKPFRFAQGVLEYRLRLAWNQALGNTIAQQAQPLRLARGLLTVAVRSSVWVQELQMMAPEILDRLRQHRVGRAVEKIRFRIGSVEPPEKPAEDLPRLLSRVELNSEALSQLDHLCATVGDPELRSIIHRVAEKDAKLRQLREIGGKRGSPELL